MPTTYYEAGLPATLIPVQFIAWAKTPAHAFTGCHNAVVRLKRSHGTYRAGEVLHVSPNAVVVKAGRRDYHQLVRQAELPAIVKADVLPARVTA